jgi:4-alpha-glucanotransferase
MTGAPPPARRRSGLLLPLFSCPSSASWGIGEIGDIEPVTAWLDGAGQRILQLLPINEMAPGQQSPYSAISAMAIDPIFIRLPGVPEFEALGGEGALSPGDRDALAKVRRTPIVDYAGVRALKAPALRAAFERFVDAEWRRDSERARTFRDYIGRESWWIHEYGLFRAIHAREGEQPWTVWPAPLAQREPAALDWARRDLAAEVRFFEYLQWLADMQWQEARRRSHDVALFGDLPFMVDGDSADVWARQHQFHLDASIGAPPDAFSADGQDWGTPLYRWDVIAREGFGWLHDRARRGAAMFDGYRIDHLVGFYRTYGRPRNGAAPYFTPASEAEQLALGERVLGVFREPRGEVIAEDLGTVPDFVRASLARLGVPGFRVFRWERQWHVAGQPFRDPADYPSRSVAASGTHDTETLAVWWDSLPEDDRRKVASLDTIQRLQRGGELDGVAALARAPFELVRDILLEALFASGSDTLLMPVQDAFGRRDRINDPAVVADTNWVYRLPWPIDRWNDVPEARERQERLRAWASSYHRG